MSPEFKHPDRNQKAREFWGTVECVPGCGGCCPNDCVLLNRASRTCTVHPGPERTIQEAWELEFGHGCGGRPEVLFINMFGCPVVVEIMERMLRIKIETEYSHLNQIVLSDIHATLDQTERARGWGLAEGEEWPPAEVVRGDVEQVRDEVMAELRPLLQKNGVRGWRP